ncbi:hypothetical protein FJT64_005156 [Amphibalanus amphitrite]|uniref:Uncharacterized protein n=1 Tax=Amphibalanus amphitrite TaxID=1232801 RepID=A0A6A4VWX8_AMPAM|nr:hypothetical protein FJT64_005156 [Amphibalanus amphitrite]
MRTIEEREDTASEADTAETPFPAAQPINYAQLLLEKRKRFRKTLSLPQIIGRPPDPGPLSMEGRLAPLRHKLSFKKDRAPSAVELKRFRRYNTVVWYRSPPVAENRDVKRVHSHHHL